MSSTTLARELLNRATKQMRKLPSFFTEDEMNEFYPTDGDMEYLWRTWCEALENDLHAMNKELEDGATTHSIYEECAEVDEKNYGYIDHGVLSAKYHEHLLPYIVQVYRVLGFYGTHHVLTHEENYVVETICDRVSEYIMDYLTKKAKDELKQYATCEDCGRNCYTGGQSYPDGYVCADCDEDEEKSEDEE